MTKNEAMAKGKIFLCAYCHKIYEELPMDMAQFNFSSKDIPKCDCGEEHFIDLREVECSAPCLELHDGIVIV